MPARWPGRPTRSGAVVVDLGLDQLDQLAEGAHHVALDARPHRRRPGLASLSRAVTLCTTIVYCWRSSSASANRNGSSSSWQNSCQRPEERGDAALAAWPRRGWRWDRPAAAGRTAYRARTPRPAGRARRIGQSGRRRRSRLVWSRKSRSSPLTLKINALVFAASAPEHARVEEAVQQEGGVGGLGGHARDAADVDVRAPRAVEELEVEVEGLVVTRQAGRQALAHLVEEQRLVALGAGGLAHLAARQRRHVDLGLEPGGQHLGRLADLGGQHAVGHRNTSLSIRAPSWRARTWETTPSMRTAGRRAGCVRRRRRRRAGGSDRARPRPRTRGGVAASVPITREGVGSVRTTSSMSGDTTDGV